VRERKKTKNVVIWYWSVGSSYLGLASH